MPKKPGIDIRPDHWEIVRSLLQQHVPQYAVWAFGSRAKWTAKDYSDLDLAVITNKPLTLSVSSGLSDDFSASDLPWKVDVVDWATTSDSFRKIIAEEYVVVQGAASLKHWAASFDLPTVRLDSVAQVNPRRKVSKGKSVPFIDMAALPQNSREINYSDVVFREARGAGAHFQNGDTLLARITPCLENGKTALVRQLKSGEVGEGSTEFITLCGIDPADNDFIYYLCRDPVFREYAIGRMEGTSGRQRVSWQSIAAYEFICPKPLERRAVALMLSALDDRITLLRETNATLEAIAQALFKSWFVDFDPVRAKMEGRAPEGMDEATAALFPDALEESELGLGLVPKGWRFGTVGDFARQHKGSINPLKSPDVVFEHFSLPAFDNQQMPVSELGVEIKSNKTSVPPDAVLLSKLNPHIPRIWLPVEVGDHAVCSTEFLVFVPALGCGASKEFIYCAFTTGKFKELLCQLVTGTSNSHQRVKPDGISTMSAVIPSPAALKAFGSLVHPIFKRIGHNLNKAQTLATLRDTLLPRLISGQLRLPEALAEMD